MGVSKVDRFCNLGKIQHQQYEHALEGENKIRQMIDDIDRAVEQVRTYQKDYQTDLLGLQNVSSTTDQLLRTRKFLQQLMQMEVDQLRQKQGLELQLQHAQAETMQRLQKVRMSDKLMQKAQVEQLAANKALDSKQMDAIASQMYTKY